MLQLKAYKEVYRCLKDVCLFITKPHIKRKWFSGQSGICNHKESSIIVLSAVFKEVPCVLNSVRTS